VFETSRWATRRRVTALAGVRAEPLPVIWGAVSDWMSGASECGAASSTIFRSGGAEVQPTARTATKTSEVWSSLGL
jgi:hypothetical protein